MLCWYGAADMGSGFGHIFRVTTFGESHGVAVGAVVEGCPPQIPLDEGLIAAELERRRPGQSRLVSQRKEPDQIEILSGLDNGMTLGTPIAMLVRNRDIRLRDYKEVRAAYRPSHADFTYDAKYGIRAQSGGGRASARETLGRVAAGAIAKQVLAGLGVEVIGWVEQVGDLVAGCCFDEVRREAVEATPVRCPTPEVAAQMIAMIEHTRKQGDSIGGVVCAVARGVPPGWGEPVFDKLEADLAKAMLSIPAAKGFESGLGFAAASMRGSTHNDRFIKRADGTIATRSNHSGGIQGGISNGMPITIRVAFKPTATILMEQQTVSPSGEAVVLKPSGRHDPCVLPRAVPIVEAMMNLVLVDHYLRQRAVRG